MLLALVYSCLRLVLDIADVRLRLKNPTMSGSTHVPYSNRVMFEDVVEGRPVLLTGEPAAFHVEPVKDGGVEQLRVRSLALL